MLVCLTPTLSTTSTFLIWTMWVLLLLYLTFIWWWKSSFINEMVVFKKASLFHAQYLQLLCITTCMWVFGWLVLSLFQFITNMINVNMTSVCQVSLVLYRLLLHPPPPGHLFCSLPPLLLFLPWYLQCLGCSQSNGGLHQRCLYSPPTQLSLSLSPSVSLSLLLLLFLFHKTISQSPFSPLKVFSLFLWWPVLIEFVVLFFLDDPPGAAQNGWEVS